MTGLDNFPPLSPQDLGEDLTPVVVDIADEMDGRRSRRDRWRDVVRSARLLLALLQHSRWSVSP